MGYLIKTTIIVALAVAVIGLIWQIVGLMPVFEWFTYPGTIPPSFWVFAGIKIVIAIVCLASAWGFWRLFIWYVERSED